MPSYTFTNAVVTERWSGPALVRASGGIRALRVFDVTLVTNEEDAISAVNAFDPSTLYNAQHPKCSLIYVEAIESKPGGFNIWTVTVTYVSNPAGRHIDPANPLLEPPQYRFEWSNFSQDADRDAYGNVIQNSAGQSFQSAIPTDVLYGTLYVTRNEPFYDAITAVRMSNAVNTLQVSFFGVWKLFPGQACCRRILPLTPITSAAVYTTVQYVIELRGGYTQDSDGFWDGFKVRIENDGVQGWYNNGGTATSGPICEMSDGNVVKVSQPVRLDKTGVPILAAAITGGTVTSGRYFIGAPGGAAQCIANPNPLPASTVFETTSDAVFVKVFPQTIRLADLNVFGF